MIINVFTAFYNAFREELKTGNSFQNKLLLTFRIIAFIASIGITFFILLVTLLSEQEGIKVEIVSLYICLFYFAFLIGNFIIPWKIILINKRLIIMYLVLLFLSFFCFCLGQFINLLFHEGTIKWESISENYPIFLVPALILTTITVLFALYSKQYRSIQKEKNVKHEWNRISKRQGS